MSTAIEIESKVLLNKDEFEKVIDALHGDK